MESYLHSETQTTDSTSHSVAVEKLVSELFLVYTSEISARETFVPTSGENHNLYLSYLYGNV